MSPSQTTNPALTPSDLDQQAYDINMGSLFITFSSFDTVFFKGYADTLTLPGTMGVLTLSAQHIPLIGLLQTGMVIIKSGDQKIYEQPVTGGYFYMHREGCTVCL